MVKTMIGYRQAAVAIFAVLASAGCASVDPAPAMRDVQATVAGRTGQRVEWEQPAPPLPAELTAGTAVQFALANNAGLRATLEEIGISQAEVAQASRLKNPEFAASWRVP